MPGYIIHLAEAENILKNLELSDDDSNKFLTGNLLPDTRIKIKKKESHFWNGEEIKFLARKPDLSIFLNKYSKYLSDPLVLGYYCHLILDVHFIDDYWANEFTFLDENYNSENLYDKIKYAKINEKNQILPIGDFLSPEYYYGDYSKTNEYYIEKYNIKFPHLVQYSCPISEVDINDMKQILINLQDYCTHNSYDEIYTLKVFNVNKLNIMIEKSTDEFLKIIRNQKAGGLD